MPDSTPHVQCRVDGRIGRVVLDRPATINALTLAMIRAVQRALDDWRADPRVELIVLTGTGERGFCAGGDIRLVHEGAGSDPASVRRLWREEYALDESLATYPKPVVSIAHGVTMGGGVGLASHVRHRVVTEDLALAMPEVAIGLAPDVAGLWLLAHAPGELGTHAALTGAHLNAADARDMGLADWVIAPASTQRLLDALQDDEPSTVLASLTLPRDASPLAAQRGWIDECYAGDDIMDIYHCLRAHGEPAARSAAAAVGAGSPTAATVTLAAIRRAGRMRDMSECLVQDYRVSSHFLTRPDLREGIRAQVIDKDRRPQWDPGSLAQVDAATVAEFFVPDGPDLDLAHSGG